MSSVSSLRVSDAPKGCHPLCHPASHPRPRVNAVSQNWAPLSFSTHTSRIDTCQPFPSSGSRYLINSLEARFYLPLGEVTHALHVGFAEWGVPELPDPTPGHRCLPWGHGASRSGGLAQETQGHWVWDRRTHARCTVLPWTHQLPRLPPNACNGKPARSHLDLTQPFNFAGNSMIGNCHRLFFFSRKTNFSRLIKAMKLECCSPVLPL